MKNYFYILLLALFSVSCDRGLSEKDEAMVRMATEKCQESTNYSNSSLGNWLSIIQNRVEDNGNREYDQAVLKRMLYVYHTKLEIDSLLEKQRKNWVGSVSEAEILDFQKKYINYLKTIDFPEDSVEINFKQLENDTLSGKKNLSTFAVNTYLITWQGWANQITTKVMGRLIEKMGTCCNGCGYPKLILYFEKSDTLFLEKDFQNEIYFGYQNFNFCTKKIPDIKLQKLIGHRYSFQPQLSNPNLTEEWQTHTIEVEASTKYDFAPKIYKTNVRFLLRKKRE